MLRDSVSPCRYDTADMEGKTVTVDLWTTVYVGTLDAAFSLTEEELFGVATIVRKLLDRLHVEGRADPETLPMPVAHELTGMVYATALGRRLGIGSAVRPTTDEDCYASPEAWREALTRMLTTAYPELSPSERLFISKVFADLLRSLGVPQRAASCHPQMVIDAYLELDQNAR